MNAQRVAAEASGPLGASGFFRGGLAEGAPSLVRLRHFLADLSADDRIDDPFLERLFDELSADDATDLALAHARTWLLRSRCLPERVSDRVDDWRSALRSLASERAPGATLLLDAGGRVVLPAAQYRRLRTYDPDDLAIAPPCGPLVIDRSQTLRLVGADLFGPDHREVLPLPEANDVARWEDDFARWSRRARARAAKAGDWTTALSGRIADRILLAPDEAPWGTPWADLDRLVGAVWLALGRAAESREIVELASGERLVAVGAGVCLALDVRQHVRRDRARVARAAFRTTLGPLDLWSPLTRHTGASGALGDATEPGWELPVALHVTGSDVALDIRFAFVPWLAEGAGIDLMRLREARGRP